MGVPFWKGFYGLVPQTQLRELTLADRVTDCDVYRGPKDACVAGVLRRGTYGSGERSGWVLTSSKVKGERGGIATLTLNWEIGGPFADPAFVPLDDFRCEPVELYPKVEKHKLLSGPTYPANPGDRISAETINMCYAAVKAPDTITRAKAVKDIEAIYFRTVAPPTGQSWHDQCVWGLLLTEWLTNGIETYYLAGLKYTYISHSFEPPELNQGGYIQTPDGGPLAGNTTFSWLRLADSVEPVGVNGSIYRLNSTWLGGPDGNWDRNIYKAPTA